MNYTLVFPTSRNYFSESSSEYESIEQEFEATIRRAFTPQPCGFIFYDSRRQVFFAECIAYGEERGWLDGKLNEIEAQYSRYEARLTDAGKLHFGFNE